MPLASHYRLQMPGVRVTCGSPASGRSGFFRFGDAICFAGDAVVAQPGSISNLDDVSGEVRIDRGVVSLPFDPAQVLDNLLLEQYPAGVPSSGFRKAYYAFRRLFLPSGVKQYFQRAYLSGWKKIEFPRWPVDTSVESIRERLLVLVMQAAGLRSIPFIWFWPDGHDACAMVTHDVEARSGRDFCARLMDWDDSFGIKSSFSVVPECRYEVPEAYLAAFRERGFEICVHDLNHDGILYRDLGMFTSRAKAINEYGRRFGARGFRAGSMWRNQRWYDALEFDYDMSVPNVAHLEAQRGGCCTVMPYFVGNLVELPLTTTQDYSLFHVLRDRSLTLWRRQIELILHKHGLISILSHPDYLQESWAEGLYRELLQHVADLREKQNVWVAKPGEISSWWRQRSKLRLVSDADGLRIEGEGAERARVAYAHIDDQGQLTYEVTSCVQAG